MHKKLVLTFLFFTPMLDAMNHTQLTSLKDKLIAFCNKKAYDTNTQLKHIQELKEMGAENTLISNSPPLMEFDVETFYQQKVNAYTNIANKFSNPLQNIAIVIKELFTLMPGNKNVIFNMNNVKMTEQEIIFIKELQNEQE